MKAGRLRGAWLQPGSSAIAESPDVASPAPGDLPAALVKDPGWNQTARPAVRCNPAVGG